MPISSPNPMLDHLLKPSHQDDSNKSSNIGFGEEITKVEMIEGNLAHSGALTKYLLQFFSSSPPSQSTSPSHIQRSGMHDPSKQRFSWSAQVLAAEMLDS